MLKQLAVVGVAVGAALGAGCSDNRSMMGAPGLQPSPVVATSGLTQTQAREVGPFTAISVADAGIVTIEPGSVESLVVTADAAILPLVDAVVQNGRLMLGLHRGARIVGNATVSYRVTMRAISMIEGSGASHITIDGVAASHLDVRLSAAAQLTASGSADSIDLLLSGASRCEARALRARVVTMGLSGASYALLRAADALSGTATGASTLEYFGDPTVTVQTSGASVVRRLGS